MFPPKSHTSPLYIYLFYGLFSTLVFISLFWLYQNTDVATVAKIGQSMQILNVILIAITGIVAIQTYATQMEDRARNIGLQYASIAQSKTGSIDKLFMNNPNLDRLYFQMYADDPHIQRIVQSREPIAVTPDILKSEHHAANLIFQQIADVFAVEKLDQITEDNIEWVNTFKRWMQSPILKSHWTTLSQEQHPDLQKFVNENLIKFNSEL